MRTSHGIPLVVGSVIAISVLIASVVAGIAQAQEKEEGERYSFDDAWNEENERQGIIQLNTDDPSYALHSMMRDTSNDPKRESGPMWVNRQLQGSPFVGIPTFYRRPVALTPEDLVAGDVDVAFVGLPLDFSSIRRGTLLGPQAIRTGEIGYHWRADGEPSVQHTESMIDPLAILNVVDYGDISPEPFNLERGIGTAIPIIREAAETGATLFICGGSHSVPYPTIRGIVEANGGQGSIGVIHFDAHQDAQAYGYGHPAHYGTFIRSLVTDNLVHGRHIIQVGQRGAVNSADGLAFQRRNGIKTYYMAEILRRGWEAVSSELLATVSDEDFPDKLYISIDLDFYDSSVAPGTTLPEPGGATPADFFPLLRALTIQKHVVGVDLVEVAPMNDNQSGTTMLLGSRTFFEAMVGMALRKQGVTDPWYLHPDLLTKN